MDFPSAMRLFAPKILDYIQQCIEDADGKPPSPFLTGIQSYLKLCRRYTAIFMSKKDTYLQRIKSAGYVATYLRLWRQWVKKDPKLKPAINYITEEAFKDVLLSCHFVVLLLKYFGQSCPGIKVPLYLVGTDVCEDLFSSVGSWNLNKCTYTAHEAAVTQRSRLQLSTMEAEGSIKIPCKDRRKKPPFDEPEGMQDAEEPDPTDPESKVAWESGCERSQGRSSNTPHATEAEEGWWV